MALQAQKVCIGMKSGSCRGLVRIILPAFALVLLHAASSMALVLPPGDIVCVPQQPIVHSGEEVGIRAFVAAPARTHLRYEWKATAGQISGSGDEVMWSSKEVLSGVYTSTVTVLDGGTALGECSVQLTVIEAERGNPGIGAGRGNPGAEAPAPPRSTARTFLAPGMKEEPGYGLYSYLLFGSPPTESTRPRFLKAIQACLEMIPTAAELRQYRPASKLNILYVPVKVRAEDSPTAEWLLDHYDFVRARVLLDLLSPRYQTGPYIVSVLTPLSSLQAIPQDHLFQDMSLVPTDPQDLLSWWIRAFLNQAAQEQFWKPQTGEMLTLKVRTMLSVEAAALPEVKSQLASWITWAK
jgi:hypothetical protein